MNYDNLNDSNKIGMGEIADGYSGDFAYGTFHKMDSTIYFKYKLGAFKFCELNEWENENTQNRISDFVEYPKMIKYQLEYTDTFGGEANYSWVERLEIDLPENVSDSTLIRHAKKAMGIQIRHKPVNDFGDMLSLDFYCSCTRLFISVKD